MHLIILAAMAETATQSNYLWLLAASAVPLAFLVAQKNKKRKKMGFLKRWLLNFLMKKVARKKGEAGDLLLGLLFTALITFLLSLLVGWLWAGAIVLVTFIIWGAVSKKKSRKSPLLK